VDLGELARVGSYHIVVLQERILQGLRGDEYTGRRGAAVGAAGADGGKQAALLMQMHERQGYTSITWRAYRAQRL
jgi:hypothetical protein